MGAATPPLPPYLLTILISPPPDIKRVGIILLLCISSGSARSSRRTTLRKSHRSHNKKITRRRRWYEGFHCDWNQEVRYHHRNKGSNHAGCGDDNKGKYQLIISIQGRKSLKSNVNATVTVSFPLNSVSRSTTPI